MAVSRLVLEPNEDAPTRIQIWGLFSELDQRKSTYGSPVYGYLYYRAAPGKEEQCRTKWNELRKLVAAEQLVAFGMCGSPRIAGHLRKPTEHVESPLVFPLVEEGFTNARRFCTFSPHVKQLLEQAPAVSPATGAAIPSGKVTLGARTILDKQHANAMYVFEIESTSGETETSSRIAVTEKRAKWTPKMVVRANEKYTWRVRATEGQWQGPVAQSDFEVKGRP
jgi:hypothetical protein